MGGHERDDAGGDDQRRRGCSRAGQHDHLSICSRQELNRERQQKRPIRERGKETTLPLQVELPDKKTPQAEARRSCVRGARLSYDREKRRNNCKRGQRMLVKERKNFGKKLETKAGLALLKLIGERGGAGLMKKISCLRQEHRIPKRERETKRSVNGVEAEAAVGYIQDLHVPKVPCPSRGEGEKRGPNIQVWNEERDILIPEDRRGALVG